MRRALAAAVLGISLWLGSLAWSGFVLLRTVLDPERSREVAETLYEDEVVRAQLAENIAVGVDAALPPGVVVPRSEIEEAAADALDSPAVEAVLVDALARTHAAFLGEGDPPGSVSFGADALPGSPELAVDLPTEHVPDVGPVRDAIAAAVPVLALASAAGALLALLITSNRPAVLRRAGVWAVGLSATVLLLAYGVPYVAEALLPGQAAVVAALVRAMAETIRIPALALAVAGAVCVVVATLWRFTPAPPPASDPPLRRRRPAPPPGARRDLPRPAVRPAMPEPERAPATRVGPSPSATLVAPAPRPVAHDATAVEGAPPRRTRWVEGAGWVLDPSEPLPPQARWVPGVGYVVDER